MAVWALCKISTKNWQWTASTGVAVVVLLSFVGVCVAVALPKFKKLQSLTDNLNRVTRENLTGLNVVRAYNAEGYQQKKFNDANDELTKTQLFANALWNYDAGNPDGNEWIDVSNLLDRRLFDQQCSDV